MAEDNEDKSSKTEEPTDRKLNKLREEGNIPKSKEVNNFFMLMGIILVLLITMPITMEAILNVMGGAFTEAGGVRMDTPSATGNYMSMLTQRGLMAMAPTFILLIVFALAGGFIQTGLIFAPKAIQPKMNRISLIKGFERMFSIKSVAEFLKSLVKLTIVGVIIGFILFMHREEFVILHDKTPLDVAKVAWTVIIRMFLGALVIAFVLAVVDFLFQRAQFMKEQRMSRRELKDEMKESEGDPFIKNRQRQIRQERARARMMEEVPKSDVVITNPTHFSIALSYDEDRDAAPRVIAKGLDHLALKIREIAKEHDIPLYEDPPLARQLYYQVELEEEVPLELYEAIAKVIAYIYGLRQQKMSA